LSRVVLSPFIAYYIYRGGGNDTIVAAILLSLAGVTDGLDGYLARRMNCVSRLGIALDPIADKIMAGVVVGALYLWRDLPLWLVGLIIGRDLLILLGGMILLRGRSVNLPSNLTGKYAFSAIAVLIGSYLLRFTFGINLMTWITFALILASLIGYGRVFTRVRRGEEILPFKDRTWLRLGRIILTVGISALYLIKLYLDLTGPA